jgi:hypothetical protein
VPDFHIINHGSIVTFQPLTPEAQSWWDENVNDESGLGAVEPRYAGPIVEGILEEGMTIQ